MVLSGTAKEIDRNGKVKDVPFKAIPYSTWNKPRCRPDGCMDSRSAEYARPTPEATIASKARTLMIQAPIQKDAPESASVETWAWGVNDQWEPKRSSDISKPYHYWWLKNGTVETLAYESTSLIPYRTYKCIGWILTIMTGISVCRKAGNYIIKKAKVGKR